MNNMFQNQSFVKYSIHLKDTSLFSINAIFASYYASRSYIKGNVNWLRSDLSSSGLMLICIYLLCTPALFPHLNSGYGTLNVRIPSFIGRVLRQFAPMTKGCESYSTCGGTESFEAVITFIINLEKCVRRLISSGEVNLFGYQVPGLSSKDCYISQLERVCVVLTAWSKCQKPETLVIEILITLSSLKSFEAPDFEFEQFDQSCVTPVSDVQVGYGIRKYVRVGSKHLSFLGDPSHFTISLFQLFVDKTSIVLDSETRLDLSNPIVGAAVVTLSDLSIGDWFLSLLNSRFGPTESRDGVPQNRSARREKSFPTFRSDKGVTILGTNAVKGSASAESRRGIHTSPVNYQHELPSIVDLWEFDGKTFRYVGMVKRV